MKSFRDDLAQRTAPSQRRSRVLRKFVDDIIAGKPSYHSALGSTVCAMLSELESRGEPYVLRAWPGKGYVIEKGGDEPATVPLTTTET